MRKLLRQWMEMASDLSDDHGKHRRLELELTRTSTDRVEGDIN